MPVSVNMAKLTRKLTRPGNQSRYLNINPNLPSSLPHESSFSQTLRCTRLHSPAALFLSLPLPLSLSLREAGGSSTGAGAHAAWCRRGWLAVGSAPIAALHVTPLPPLSSLPLSLLGSSTAKDPAAWVWVRPWRGGDDNEVCPLPAPGPLFQRRRIWLRRDRFNGGRPDPRAVGSQCYTLFLSFDM